MLRHHRHPFLGSGSVVYDTQTGTYSPTSALKQKMAAASTKTAAVAAQQAQQTKPTGDPPPSGNSFFNMMNEEALPGTGLKVKHFAYGIGGVVLLALAFGGRR